MTVLDQNLEPISLRVDEFGRLKVVGTGGGGGGVSDHGDLTGLADDDHPQYLNNARGDARYAGLAHTHLQSEITGLPAALAAKADASSLGTAAYAATGAFATAAQGAKADAAAVAGSVASSGLTMSTARLLGRSTAGTGALEEITLGTNLSFSGTTLNAAGGGGSPGGSDGEIQRNSGGAFAGSNLSQDASGRLTAAAGTQTTAGSALTVRYTANNGAASINGLTVDATNTASASSSSLLDLKTGGTTRTRFDTSGALNFSFAGGSSAPNVTAGSNTLVLGSTSGFINLTGSSGNWTAIFDHGQQLTLHNNTGLSFSNSNGGGDAILKRVVAGTIGQYSGTTAQEYQVYGTRTNDSNYRRLSKGMSTAGVAFLRPEGAGTGASGNVLHISGLPTSNPGPGILWNDAGTVKVGT
jgi:hypothetical protein